MGSVAQSNKEHWNLLRTLSAEEKKKLGYSTKASIGMYSCKSCGKERMVRTSYFTRKNMVCESACFGITKGSNRVVTGINDLATTHSHLLVYFTDVEDAKNLSYGSKKKVSVRCPHCNYSKTIAVNNLVNRGFVCPSCSDGVSRPEKFIFELLTQLGIDFTTQFKPSGVSKKYDFYIPSMNTIIETHGEQHYEGKRHPAWKSFEEERDNDIDKWMLAQLKFGKDLNYVIIDCQDTRLSYMKNSVLNSKLASLLDLTSIDWYTVGLRCEKNIVVEVSKVYNQSDLAINEIASMFKLNRKTVRDYIKRGSELGICDYDSTTLKQGGKIHGAN